MTRFSPEGIHQWKVENPWVSRENWAGTWLKNPLCTLLDIVMVMWMAGATCLEKKGTHLIGLSESGWVCEASILKFCVFPRVLCMHLVNTHFRLLRVWFDHDRSQPT